MPQHDQERFEDYLELERYIADLQAGRKSALPSDLTPEQLQIYQMAAQFHSSADSDASAPRPEFVAKLYASLLSAQQEESAPDETQDRREEEIEAKKVEAPQIVSKPPLRRRLSRRAVFTGGAAAAASLALGGVAGAAFERAQNKDDDDKIKPPTGAAWNMDLVGPEVATQWLRVVALEQLGTDAHAFHTGGVIGYVVRNSEQQASATQESVIALSAACTHMGCIVQWQTRDRLFHCPCHDGQFTESGRPAGNSYLRELPRLKTKIGEDGYVYVEVPELKG